MTTEPDLKNAGFAEVTASLRAILQPYEPHLVLQASSEKGYSLNTRHIMKNGQPLFFGSVQPHKNYVSFYLMPVYVFPDLLQGISAELRKRMQGKSCFNFKVVDAALFDELAELTRRGFEQYQAAGYI